jgi:hypothetical protein
MTLEKQNEFLLSLVDRLYLELGAYVAFLEWVKLLAEGEDVEAILTQCRLDSALRSHVDATLQNLSAKLIQSEQLAPDRAYREFLERWTPKGKPN